MSYMIETMRAKLHNAVVTEANLDYEGSVTIGEELLIRSTIKPFERVQVLNIDNGERIETYVIAGKEREICLNGAAARKFNVGDHVIIIAYVFETLGAYPYGNIRPIVILNGQPDNQIKEIK